jgi:hypothetical protein
MMRGSARIGEGHGRTKSGEDASPSANRGLRALKRRRFGRMKMRPADGDYWSQEQLHAYDHEMSIY